MPLHFSVDKGVSLEEWGVLAQILLSAFGDFPPSIADLRSADFWEVLHSKGGAGPAFCHPGEFEGLHSPKTAVNRVQGDCL